MQFRYNLGSGEAVAQISGAQLADGNYHNIHLRREGRVSQLQADELYFSEATTPGTDILLDISPGAIYLGSQVVEDGDGQAVSMNGFSGCIRGVVLDDRDLPFSEPSDDFDFSSSDGPIALGCWVPPTGSVTETSSSVIVYAATAGILIALFLMVLVFVLVALVIRKCSCKLPKKGSDMYELRQTDFRPMVQVRRHSLSSTNEGNVRLYSQEGGGERDLHQELASPQEDNHPSFGRLNSESSSKETRFQLQTQSSPTLEVSQQQISPELRVINSNTSSQSENSNLTITSQGITPAPFSAQVPDNSVARPKPVVPGSKPNPELLSVSTPESHPLSENKKRVFAVLSKLKQSADSTLLKENFDEIVAFNEEGSMTPLSKKSLLSLYQMQSDESDEELDPVDLTQPRFAKLQHLLHQLNVDDDDLSSTATTESFAHLQGAQYAPNTSYKPYQLDHSVVSHSNSNGHYLSKPSKPKPLKPKPRLPNSQDQYDLLRIPKKPASPLKVTVRDV